MRLFFRRQEIKTTENLPPEVKKYYETGQRERRGVAWMLAFATLIITIVVGFGAFLGGRWLFRTVAGGGKTTTTKTVDTEKPQNTGKPATPQNSSNKPQPTPSNQQNQTTPTTPVPSAPTSGNQNLAQTGPADNIAIFAIASVIGIGYYELRTLRKLS